MRAKTVIITGASRGIGAATAIKFARSGYNTVINYHQSEEVATKLKQQLSAEGCSVAIVQADVSNHDEAILLIDKTVKLFGKVDCLVANAAIECCGLFTEVNKPEYDKVMNTNFGGVFFSAQAAAKDMLKYKSGRIITVSSVWGQVGASCEALYSAAKAAVIGFTKAIAKELAPSNIAVNCVSPGIIDTDMLNSYTCDDKRCMCDVVPMCRLGKPNDVAEAIFYLADTDTGYMTGQVLGVNGGLVV